jgi:pimeloyl-ACP methyl ester carboxylesterase
MNVLLVRGLAREARHWGDFPRILEGRTGHHAFTLDLPGTGDQADRAAPTRLDDVVDDMRDRWRRLAAEHPGRWAVFGISLGGMVVLNWASRYLPDFAAAVVANTSAANLGHPLERLTAAGLRALYASARSRSAREREQHVLGVIANHEDARRRTLDDWVRIYEERPLSGKVAVRQMIAASGFPVPRKVPVPTLVLVSPQDRFVSAACSERLAARIGAQVARHPTAGHAITVDAPEWVADEIGRFLEERQVRASGALGLGAGKAPPPPLAD